MLAMVDDCAPMMIKSLNFIRAKYTTIQIEFNK